MEKRTVVLVAVFAMVEAGCGGVGEYTSVAVGSDGRGLISYQDTPNGVLKVAHCDDVACTSAVLSPVDSSDAGTYTSVVIGVDGLGLISYIGTRQAPNGGGAHQLRVAHCEEVACRRASVSIVDDPRLRYPNPDDPSHYREPSYTSMAVGRDGLGLISYRDYTGGDLLVAHCEDVACTSATVTTLEQRVGTIGEYSSITVGSDGLGLIAYHNRDARVDGLKVAHCEDTACTTATLSTIGGAGYGAYPHLAVGSDGLGLISSTDGFEGGNLRVAHCADLACTRADAITILDRETPTGRVGKHTSVGIGRDGLGLISYWGALSNFGNGNLKVAHCQDVACRRAVVSTLDRSTGDVGWYASVAFGADGLGLISYWDALTPALKAAHCQNVPCTTATLTTLDTGTPSATGHNAILFSEAKSYVDHRIGRDSWEALLARAGLQGGAVLALEAHQDADALALVSAVSALTGQAPRAVLEDFGDFVAPDLLKMYASLRKNEWKTLDVIERLGTSSPGLRCERVSSEEVLIHHYTSNRQICSVVKGVAKGLARHFGETVLINELTGTQRGDQDCRISVRRVVP